jgi:hypothetical protein
LEKEKDIAFSTSDSSRCASGSIAGVGYTPAAATMMKLGKMKAQPPAHAPQKPVRR